MKNISTFIYTVNDFESEHEDVYDANDLFDTEEFAEVYDYLSQTESVPSEACMSKIFEFARSLKV